MKQILILVFLLIPSLVFGKQVVYYCDDTKSQVYDVSGEKSLEDIKKDFGECNYDVMDLNKSSDAVRIIDGQLEKYDYVKVNKNKKDAKKANKETKKQLIKAKLGLSNDEWKDLKEALGVE